MLRTVVIGPTFMGEENSQPKLLQLRMHAKGALASIVGDCLSVVSALSPSAVNNLLVCHFSGVLG